MKVCIHRGTRQIGGTCIEIEAQGLRIAVDVGLPLDAADYDGPDGLLPAVAGFRKSDDSLLGVVISHPHQDHYGLLPYVRPDVPVFMGEAACRIFKAAGDFIPSGLSLSPAGFLRDREPLSIGPFTITPYLVDHSAYDAYALLVEGDGRQLFYSGDFRGHGRKSGLFEKLVRDAPKDVDVLLMEGSTISRDQSDEGFPTESDLETEFTEAFRQTQGMALIFASGQNIDRIVTVYRACKRSRRNLIIDLYTAAVLAATGNDHLPQSHWRDVRVFLPSWQRRHIKINQLFDVLHPHHAHRIYPEALAAEASQSVLLFRPSMIRDLDRANCLSGAGLIYSLWEGYLRESRLGLC